MAYPYDPESAKEMFRKLNIPREYTVKIVCIEKYSKFANTISIFLSKVGIKSTDHDRREDRRKGGYEKSGSRHPGNFMGQYHT